MFVADRRSDTSRGSSFRRTRLACLAAATVVAVSACGGSGSSKPAYCGARTNLENSIKGLTSLNLSSGVSGLESQLTKIESDANALVNSAKSSFPSQTSAIHSSVSALSGSVKSLSSSPSASEIATVATQAASVVTSVKDFGDTTKSKCS